MEATFQQLRDEYDALTERIDATVLRCPGSSELDPLCQRRSTVLTKIRSVNRIANGGWIEEDEMDDNDNGLHDVDSDDYDDDASDGLDDRCPNCHIEYDDIDCDFQLCHLCGYDNDPAKNSIDG